MTVIAWDGKTLAADKRACTGSSFCCGYAGGWISTSSAAMLKATCAVMARMSKVTLAAAQTNTATTIASLKAEGVQSGMSSVPIARQTKAMLAMAGVIMIAMV